MLLSFVCYIEVFGRLSGFRHQHVPKSKSVFERDFVECLQRNIRGRRMFSQFRLPS